MNPSNSHMNMTHAWKRTGWQLNLHYIWENNKYVYSIYTVYIIHRSWLRHLIKHIHAWYIFYLCVPDVEQVALTPKLCMNNHAWKKTLYIHNTLKLKTHSLKIPQPPHHWRSRWRGWHLCCRSWWPVTWFASLAEASASWQMVKKRYGCVHTLGMGFLYNLRLYIYNIIVNLGFKTS